MDVVETFDVTDCELIRSDADVWSVFLVECIDLQGDGLSRLLSKVVVS
jgi:hypothetical protein